MLLPFVSNGPLKDQLSQNVVDRSSPNFSTPIALLPHPWYRLAKYCHQHVCIVCLSVRSHIWKTTWPNSTKFSVHVTCGSGSVLLWRQSDRLYTCTSGFVYDVMFHVMGPIGQNQAWHCFVEFARCRYWGEVWYLRLLCCSCQQRSDGDRLLASGESVRRSHVVTE